VVRPRLLDLFCGAGGCSVGYARAGFEVVGVDLSPQPHYPFEFHQADAMTFPLDGFDAVHGSPICQGHANVTAWRGVPAAYADLLTPTIARLSAQSLPWVVENVPEAPVRPDYLLCGTNFGLKVRRHRAFQVGGWSAAYELLPPCRCWRNKELLPFMHKGERAFADAMGCTWMSKEEGRQAIPPAYTEHIGRQLLAVMAPA
jgi:DNA (cytosine-5)-methyltransferase 1